MKLQLTLALLLAGNITIAQSATVTMSNQQFSPSRITITAGTTVTWVNKSNEQHTSTSGTGCSPDGKWNSGNLDPKGSYSHTFESEGTYSYFCIPHCSAGMTGTVEVKGSGKKTGGTSSEEKKK
jgi:plastocyanin